MKQRKHRHGAGFTIFATAAGFLAGAALESALRTQKIAQLDEARKQVEAQLHGQAGEGGADGQ